MSSEAVIIRGSVWELRGDKTGWIAPGYPKVTTGLISRTFDENRTTRVRTPRPVGWLYPKPYFLDRVSNTRLSGEVKSWLPGMYDYVHYVGCLDTFGGSVPPQRVSSAGQQQRLEVKTLAKLKQQKVNLGVAFAEAQQTADLVGSAAKRIGTAYRALSHGQFRKAAQSLGVNPRVAPRHWLELQYGWKPLLSDVDGAFQALLIPPPHHWVVTVTKKERVKAAWTQRMFETAGICTDWEMEEFQGGFCRLDYEPGNTFFSSLSSVGVTNPLEVVWEKVPYSFIVDWFLPIGDWLGSMDAAYGWRFKSGSYSSLLKRGAIIKSGSNSLTITAGGSGSWRRVILNRTVYTSSPLPSFPGLKNPVSLVHAANGLSLLAEAFGRAGAFNRRVR